MNRYDCGSIRDLLAPLVRGEMLPHEVASAQNHIDGCEDCRAEVEIVRLLQEVVAPVPPGLDTRVLAAVRRGRFARTRQTRLAFAAMLALAVFGGSLIFDRSADGTPDLEAVSWAAAQDPMLHGGSELPELSVEELEMLLEELDQ
jgi:hypothetical protein